MNQKVWKKIEGVEEIRRVQNKKEYVECSIE